MVSGGKRFRAAFCYWGHRAVRPEVEDERALVRACAALELLHASALVHDDYMDASDTRRGRPAVHRAFETEHRADGWRGDPEQYGASAAILLGDLLLSWADELLRRCGLPQDRVERGPRRLRPVPLRGDRRAVPRCLGPGAWSGRRRHRDDGAALQVREVLHRAAAARRRRPGRRRRRTRWPSSRRTGCRSARRSSSATTCWGCSATPRPPASRPATTWSRASARSWWRWRWTRRAPRTRRCSTARSAPRSTPTRSSGCGGSSTTPARTRQVESVIGELVDLALAALDKADVDEGARGVLRELASAATDRVV